MTNSENLTDSFVRVWRNPDAVRENGSCGAGNALFAVSILGSALDRAQKDFCLSQAENSKLKERITRLENEVQRNKRKRRTLDSPIMDILASSGDETE